MNKNAQRGAEQHREPVACANCGRDLLETRFGVLVLVGLRGCWPRRFVHAYWACKGPCDVAIGAAFGANAYTTSWKSIADLTNPLEYRLWDTRTAHLIGDGRISGLAATEITELRNKLAWVAAERPTDQDLAEFRFQRMFDDL